MQHEYAACSSDNPNNNKRGRRGELRNKSIEERRLVQALFSRLRVRQVDPFQHQVVGQQSSEQAGGFSNAWITDPWYTQSRFAQFLIWQNSVNLAWSYNRFSIFSNAQPSYIRAAIGAESTLWRKFFD